MEGHNFERLKAFILPLSRSSLFEVARQEWDLEAIEISDEFDRCPCGKEIKEHCYIRNRMTGHSTYVGNVCINRFVGIDTGNLFEGLRRIAQDESSNANADLIDYAQRSGYLYDKEFVFLTQTMLKRNLSSAQVAWKKKINRRILNKTVVRRRSVR